MVSEIFDTSNSIQLVLSGIDHFMSYFVQNQSDIEYHNLVEFRVHPVDFLAGIENLPLLKHRNLRPLILLADLAENRDVQSICSLLVNYPDASSNWWSNGRKYCMFLTDYDYILNSNLPSGVIDFHRRKHIIFLEDGQDCFVTQSKDIVQDEDKGRRMEVELKRFYSHLELENNLG